MGLHKLRVYFNKNEMNFLEMLLSHLSGRMAFVPLIYEIIWIRFWYRKSEALNVCHLSPYI